jgi:hypothetical protein
MLMIIALAQVGATYCLVNFLVLLSSFAKDIESEAALLLLAALTCKNAQPSDVFKKLHVSLI